jgi:hypothetical protein
VILARLVAAEAERQPSRELEVLRHRFLATAAERGLRDLVKELDRKT